LPSELADIVIRVAQLSHVMGIDLGQAIEDKLAHSAIRSHRHGGRNL
jgi:NTP pyrophosphatase (non-canonical NTP hydrolase)